MTTEADFTAKDVRELRDRLERIRRSGGGRRINEQIRLITLLLQRVLRRTEREHTRQRFINDMAQKNSNEQFREMLKKHLDKVAVENPFFSDRYTDNEHTFDECCDYIYTVVKASDRVNWSEDDVYELALHYYGADELEVLANLPVMPVVTCTVDFTDDRYYEMRLQAEKEYRAKVIAEIERKAREARSHRKVETEEDCPVLFG